YIVSGNYISDLDNDFIAAISDPFGLRTYGFAVRYWTPAEMNTIGAPMTTEIIVNRAIWIAVGLSLLGFTLVRYKMVLASGGGRRKQDQTVAPEEPEARSGPTPALPQVEARYDL